MPLACDPHAAVRVILSTDRDKPNPPTLLYRHLSYRQWIELQHLQDTLSGADADQVICAQLDWLKRGLVGWERMPDPEAPERCLPFDADRIADLVTMYEVQEILQARLIAGVPSLEDKKKLPSPSASDTKPSVAAVADTTDAATSLTPASP